MKLGVAAIVTIKDAGKMTAKGRGDIAKWLREQADSIEKTGDTYSSHYVGRYYYEYNDVPIVKKMPSKPKRNHIQRRYRVA